MNYFDALEQEVSCWPHLSVHPHRFGGREFRFGSAEVGHIHPGLVVDIPFPRAVRHVLLADGVAEEHRWVPNSGWITFRIRREHDLKHDLKHALWLMRLSYLHYSLKTSTDPRTLFEQESEKLALNSKFKSLLEPFASKVAAEPLRA